MKLRLSFGSEQHLMRRPLMWCGLIFFLLLAVRRSLVNLSYFFIMFLSLFSAFNELTRASVRRREGEEEEKDLLHLCTAAIKVLIWVNGDNAIRQ